MIDDQIESAVKSVLYSKAKELQLEIIESHFVNHVTLKGDNLRTLYWQDGYGVTSVSPGAVSSVRQ